MRGKFLLILIVAGLLATHKGADPGPSPANQPAGNTVQKRVVSEAKEPLRQAAKISGLADLKARLPNLEALIPNNIPGAGSAVSKFFEGKSKSAAGFEGRELGEVDFDMSDVLGANRPDNLGIMPR